jgi:hypothetical protein
VLPNDFQDMILPLNENLGEEKKCFWIKHGASWAFYQYFFHVSWNKHFRISKEVGYSAFSFFGLCDGWFCVNLTELRFTQVADKMLFLGGSVSEVFLEENQ